MDAIDRKILAILQRDATTPIAEIAAAVGVSQTPCWRRIKRLEETGVIAGRVALLDPDAVNLRLVAFVSIKAGRHSDRWLKGFAEAVAGIPEVVELHRMSGETDYPLKIVCPDIARYDAIYKKLIAAADFADVSTHFSMESMKATTELPLFYAD